MNCGLCIITNAKMNELRCINPHCSKSNKTFKSQRGLTYHLNNSKNCMTYLTLHCFNVDSNNVKNTFNHMKPSFNDAMLPNKIDLMPSHNNSIFHNNVNSNKKHHLLHDNTTTIDKRLHLSNSVNANINNTSEIANNNKTQNISFFPTSDSDNENNETADSKCIMEEPSTFNNIFTQEQRSIITLLKLLEDMNCPDDALPKILTWAHDSYAMGFNFTPHTTSRKSNLNWMQKMVVNTDDFFHRSTKVILNDNMTIDVMHYDFVAQLLRLLQSNRLMVQENLLISVDDPSAMYVPDDGCIGEALSGSAYREIYQRAHTMHCGNLPLLVVPICLWGDTTHIDSAGRFKLEPWSFCPLIFKQNVRRNHDFWGMLGFVKNLNTTTAQKRMHKKGDTMRMYHKQLSVILESLHNCEERLKNVPLPLGPNKYQAFDIVCSVLYIIADTEGADKICGRYGSHHLDVKRHCRMCDVNAVDLDNERCKYTYLKFCDLHQIAMHGTEQERKEHSQHKVFNAFYHVSFGGQPNGLLGCTPPDILHVIRKGIVEWSVKTVLHYLSDSDKARLDYMATSFHYKHRQQHRYNFPKTNFASGFTNLSNVKASEWIGMLYLFVILSQTPVGWFIINDALTKGGNGELRDVLSVFETILCFDAWINQNTFWSYDDNAAYKHSATQSIQKLMKQIKKWLPDPQRSQGWKNPKFHLLLHFVDMIERFGAPKNYDSQGPEHNHKYHAKQPGRRSQKTHNASDFEEQVARRISEAMIINELNVAVMSKNIDIEEESVDSNDLQESTKNATFATAIKNEEDDSYEVKWKAKQCKNITMKNGALPKFLCNLYKKDQVVFCTEYVRGNIRYRCHPNYGNKGPFYDWLLILFPQNRIYPCKLIAVVPGSDNGFIGYNLIIQQCTKRKKEGSVLFNDYEFNQNYYKVQGDSVYGPCFVLESHAESDVVSLAYDRDLWPEFFTTC